MIFPGFHYCSFSVLQHCCLNDRKGICHVEGPATRFLVTEPSMFLSLASQSGLEQLWKKGLMNKTATSSLV